MDTQKQVLSKEEAQNSEGPGIEAPELIQQDITADEKSTGQDNFQLKDKHIISSSGEVSFTKCEKTQDGETEFKAGSQNNKMEAETSHSDEGKIKTRDNDGRENHINTDKRSAAESGNEINAQGNSDLKKDSNKNDDSKNKKNISEETGNHMKEENSNTKLDNNTNENGKSKRKLSSDVAQDHGNNNMGKTVAGQNKDRKTRFSSEIMIEPKAYFQTGTETVVMMPPSSCSNEDVFENESRISAEYISSSTHAVVVAKHPDSVFPQTFLSLTLLTCLFCPMIGIFAVYKAYSVKKFIEKGDIRRANEASQHARQLGVLTLCIGFFFVLAIIAIAVLVSTLT